MEYIFTIMGKPHRLARPRLVRDIVYDSQKKEKQLYRSKIRDQMSANGYEFIENTPLTMVVTFYMPDKFKRRKSDVNPIDHIGVPDLSNLIKFAEDCFQGILFDDDSRIVSIEAHKIYALGTNPRTEVTFLSQ